ncbi:MAG TPA: Gfo/Idh/MocA family oxidoreductase [Tepidisphaeraceae bacterium]
MSDAALHYAIIGLGRAGWNIHVDQLRNRTDAKIAAVLDPVQQRRDQAAAEFGCKTYTSLPELLEQPDIDVVVIASPTHRHAPDATASFRAGKHVIVEKPMATGLAEADAMIKAAADAERKLFIHQNYRFRKEFLLMKEIIAGGTIGRVYHIRNYISSFARRNDWQTLSKNGGGVLNNTCVHFLDQILQLLPGTVTTVMSDLQQIASAGDVEDHVKAFIRTDSGATADMEISTAQNIAIPLPKWIICGTTGTFTADGTNYTLRWFDPAQAPPLTAIDGPATDRKYGNNDNLPWQEKTGTMEDAQSIGSFYDNVFAVLRANQPMIITPQSVRETMRVIRLIRTSAARTPTTPRGMGVSPMHEAQNAPDAHAMEKK